MTNAACTVTAEARIVFSSRNPSSARRRIFVTFALFAALAALAFALRPIATHDVPNESNAIVFVDRTGLPLGTILGRDDRRTDAVPLAQIAPAFAQAVVAVEDRRFAVHGAADPLSAARALWEGVVSHRFPHGASTLSMQLARQLTDVGEPPWSEFAELALAIRLENGLSKAQILEAYCNRVPMGSNIYGVEAAARTYFGVPAARLDLAQAAFLAGIPNDPVRLDPYAHFARTMARRHVVLEAMRTAGTITPRELALAEGERLDVQPRSSGIVAAPHALFALAPAVAPGRARVITTIDRPLQAFVEAQLRTVTNGLAGYDVHDGAAIVVDNHTGDVLAYAGSPDYFDVPGGGRNDGVRALRQPGSTLKPFLYELALERRDIRPETILPDAPVAYAVPGEEIYRPRDYSQRFAGPVRVRIALADSLNVPAVRVLEHTGVEHFLGRLHELGFTHLDKPASYYGLGLTLGGGEVTLYELARAYATLARDGRPTALRMVRDGSLPAETPVSAAADDPSWAFVRDVLSDPAARSAAFGTNSILSLPFDAAVKTGTSSDFRDTWTAGFSADYTVAVWMGNFDGRPMRGISGVTGAAPLWSRIMLHLHEDADPADFAPPHGYVRGSMCATTGGPPVPACPAVVREWLDPADRVAVRRAHRDPVTAEVAYDGWLAHQPLRARLPTRILFPHDGDRFVTAPGARITIDLAGATGATIALDGRAVVPHDGTYVVPLLPGEHVIEARRLGTISRAHFTVGAPLPRGHRGFTVVR